MDTFFNFALLVIGVVLLVKGADVLVEGSSAIAKKMKIPSIVIGLTVVAFGTSLPEMVVNILSSIRGNSEIAIGNIVGSNIANILLVLGITAVLCNIPLGKGTVWKEIPFSLLAMLVLLFMANDAFIDGRAFNEVSRIDGLVLIAFFIIFLYYVFGVSQVEGKNTEEIKDYTYLKSIVFILLGVGFLTLGGHWIVESSVAIAKMLGMSEAFIGLTLVAVGTSLPELATSAVAAYKKNVDLAVGNVVGSNIFNIFWVLGLSALINPLKFTVKLDADLIIAVCVTILFFAFMHVGKKHHLTTWEGIVFLCSYAGYIGFLIWRE